MYYQEYYDENLITTDNTLPIIWFDEDFSIWTPIFKRYNKIYDNDYE